ncbi:hypothetical protein NKH77_19250 [Streptomyces sp. M19]
MADLDPRRVRLLAALPYVGMAVVTVAELAVGPGVGLLPLVAIGPAFAG